MTRKQTEPQADVPTQLLDAYGNPSLVSAGELIESAWGNSVSDRVVKRYPNAAIPAPSASEGSLAFTTDNGVIWIRYGQEWRPSGAGVVVSFRVTGGGAGVTVPRATPVPVTWPVEDYDPYNVFSGTVFTCPVGWSGRWAFDWAVEFPDGGQVGTRLAYVFADPSQRIGDQNVGAQEGGTRIAGAGTALLAAGSQVYVNMYHTDTTTPLVCNTTAHQYFQGHYVGPA